MIAPTDILDSNELVVAGKCLNLSIGGEYFPAWEFPIIFGLELSEVVTVAKEWPNVDLSDDITRRAVTGSLGHLRGYPHGYEEQLEHELDVPYTRLADIARKIRAIAD